MELVDVPDLESGALRRVGSSPTSRTIKKADTANTVSLLKDIFKWVKKFI